MNIYVGLWCWDLLCQHFDYIRYPVLIYFTEHRIDGKLVPFIDNSLVVFFLFFQNYIILTVLMRRCWYCSLIAEIKELENNYLLPKLMPLHESLF